MVTGGASGLGRCIAEIYAMKGVGVAVLDVGVKEEGEREGVRWYKCDVGVRSMVEATWKKINDDVGSSVVHTSRLGFPKCKYSNSSSHMILSAAWDSNCLNQ